MPFTSLLQPPPVRWPIEWLWPVARRGGTGNLWTVPEWVPIAQPPLITTGGDSPERLRDRGTGSGIVLGQSFNDNVASFPYWTDGGGFNSSSLEHPGYAPTLEPPPGAAGWITPEATRFGWWRVSQWFGPGGTIWGPSGDGSMGVGLVAPLIGEGTFVDTATPVAPTAGANRVLCSISCTPSGGAQGLRYDAWDQDGVPLETVPLSGSFERWHTIDFFVRQATAAGPGTLRVAMDGAEVVERTWGSADLDAPSSRVDARNFVALAFYFGNMPLPDRPGKARALGPTHFRAGAFNELGVPLRS